MNGLQLSREYFTTVALPALTRDFPELSLSVAAGLVGNGSECFGYDDEQSRDHDWGTDFFLWLPETGRDSLPALRQWKSALFAENPPKLSRKLSDYGAYVGAMTCGDFYRSLIGCPEGPSSIAEWRRAPEENFAMAVNGEIFFDGGGEFTATREKLLRYYPEDLRRKKIAARCMALAQTGQYNHMRMARRGDWVTVRTVLARFNDNAIGMTFLLNRVFKPYYKWAYRRMTELPILGGEIADGLERLAVSGPFTDDALAAQQREISRICALFIDELRRQELAFSDDWFMTTQGEEVQQTITDPLLRAIPTQYE